LNFKLIILFSFIYLLEILIIGMFLAWWQGPYIDGALYGRLPYLVYAGPV